MIEYHADIATPVEPLVHVAAAGENRGRVVVNLAAPEPHRIAIAAALHLARCYGSSLESIFVENQNLIDCAAFGGDAEISLCGRVRRPVSVSAILHAMAYARRRAEARLAALAEAADVAYAARVVRGAPIASLATTCGERGPWNVIALADAVQARDRDRVLDILGDVSGATGLLLVGSAAQVFGTDIVAVVEIAEDLAPMLRLAERLRGDAENRVQILIAADTSAERDHIEIQARLVLLDRTDVDLVRVDEAVGHLGALVERFRRSRAGFVIARAGGAALPGDVSWQPMLGALACPLFLVR